jgi:hypothetical protein
VLDGGVVERYEDVLRLVERWLEERGLDDDL